MRRVAAIFLMALCLIGAGNAAGPKTSVEISPRALQAHTVFLADDLLEGRGTGTRGHAIAANYVASQFQAGGVEPGGENGGWFQMVPLIEASPLETSSKVVVTTPSGPRTFSHLEQAIVYTNPDAASGSVEGPVVFAGYGLDASAAGVNDYAGLDVRGKIVAVLMGFPSNMPGVVGAHLNSIKAETAKAHGAAGLLLIATPASLPSSPWERAVLNAKVQPGAYWQGVSKFRHTVAARSRLSAAAAEALFEGAPTPLSTIMNLTETGAPIRGFELASRARIERRGTHRSTTSAQVLGIVRGSDLKLKDEAVLVMAHIDHLGMDPVGDGDSIFNGANDNAVGVAMLIEIARKFAETKMRPRRSILFVATTAEERGFAGSDYLAHNPVIPVDKIVAATSVDAPGIRHDFTDLIAFGEQHSDLGQTVRSVARAMGIDVSPDPVPEASVFTRTDQYFFAQRGVPAIFLATGRANGGEQAFTHYRDHRYHRPTDDMSQVFDWAAGARFAEFEYRLIRRLADAQERPRWYSGDFLGDTFAPNSKRAPPVQR